MSKILIVILLLFFPLVQGLCSSSAQSNDAAQCALSILTSNPLAAAASDVADVVTCVLDGTTTQCHIECTIGWLTADCVGEVYQSCMDAQAHKCMSACSGGINVFNQGCFNAALDIASSIPKISGVVALAIVFFNCVDIVGCGLEWVLSVILEGLNNLAADGRTEFCQGLHDVAGNLPILSALLSFFHC